MNKVPQALPPGTTHFCPAFGRYPNRAMKLKGCEEWAYWTGFDWFDGCRPPPSVRREMIDVRPKRSGPSIAELIEQGYLSAIPFKCTAAPATSTWNGPQDGLPPVGLEVQTSHGTVKVLAHGICKGRHVAVAQGDDTLITASADVFRPIPTAEQLAAEEREKWAEALFDRLYPNFGWKNCIEQIQDRYRAEYDRQVKP